MKLTALWMVTVACAMRLRWLEHLPRHVSDAEKTVIISKLRDEETKLQKTVADIKTSIKTEKNSAEKNKSFRTKMKKKDQEKWDEFQQWDNRMNRKTMVGAQDVLSKIKNAVHLIKKGALSGNDKASHDLDNVVKQMS